MTELHAVGLRPRFKIRVVQPANNDGPGGSGDLAVDVSSLAVQGSRVTPQSWDSTMGGFSVGVVGSHAAAIHNYVRRGSILEVLAWWSGWPEADAEVVARGRVRDVSGQTPRWQIQCVDLVSSTISRPSASNVDQASLFYDTGAPVGPYTATSSGDHAAASTTFTMSATIDATQFVRATGGSGLLQVDDGSSAVFYLTYTGISGSDFTGVAIAASFGTTKPAITLSGATVRHVAYMRGHPLDIVRWVLCSTGTGGNGSYDVLPKSWGLAFRDAWVDSSDIDAWKANVVTATSGTCEWEVKVEGRQLSGLAWLTALLQPAGIWLTMRQGQITVRAAQTLYPPDVSSGVVLTDEDWHGGAPDVRWQAWDSAVGYEYGRIKVTGTTTSQTQDSTVGIGSAPGGYALEYDLSASHWQNESAVLAGDRARLFPWVFVIPERLTARLAGWRRGTLCPGDYVQLSSEYLSGRLEAAGATLSQRRGMVSSHGVDWIRGTVSIEISLPPHPADAEQG